MRMIVRRVLVWLGISAIRTVTTSQLLLEPQDHNHKSTRSCSHPTSAAAELQLQNCKRELGWKMDSWWQGMPQRLGEASLQIWGLDPFDLRHGTLVDIVLYPSTVVSCCSVADFSWLPISDVIPSLQFYRCFRQWGLANRLVAPPI